MNARHGLDDFRQQYGTWCTTVEPHLPAGTLQQAFATYSLLRCRRRPARRQTVQSSSARYIAPFTMQGWHYLWESKPYARIT